jgi:hypothetical protein
MTGNLLENATISPLAGKTKTLSDKEWHGYGSLDACHTNFPNHENPFSVCIKICNSYMN